MWVCWHDGLSVEPRMNGRTAGVRLGDVAGGRDNHFNLIRFLASIAVLVSHAWPISLGRGTIEPMKLLTGFSLGELSVFVFFALSGFLIAGSYDRKRSACKFIVARAARLLPGLVVSLLFVAFVMGPIVTDHDLFQYLTHRETGLFIVKNALLIKPQFTLPGVFTSNPYPIVEGSIWTLAHEVACYLMVFGLGVTGILLRPTLLGVFLTAYFLVWCAVLLDRLDIHPRIIQTIHLSLPFTFGLIFYVWRDRVVLHWAITLSCILVAFGVRDSALAFPSVALAVTYATFWMGHLAAHRLLSFNRIGDYSYGIYIYALPLQGLVIWLWGPMSPLLNIALSLPVTLFCAVLSWHLVERPALDTARTGLPFSTSFRPEPRRHQ